MSLLFGSLLCFGGYRFFMIMLPIWAFFIGLWLVAKGFALLFGAGIISISAGLTIGLILGIVLALLSWQFYELGVALLGALVTAWLSSGFMHALGFEPGFLTATITLVSALVVGILTYLREWQKYLIMLLTSIFGANAIVLAFLLPTGQILIDDLQGAGTAIQPILQQSWIWSLIWLGIAIAGVTIQYRSYRQVEFIKQEFVKYWS